MVNQVNIPPKQLAHRTLAEIGAPEKFALHVVSCGHCRSFPHDLCDRGIKLLKEVNAQVRKTDQMVQ